jgi:16S rRNA (uracil1498-N3)-methyltransferase
MEIRRFFVDNSNVSESAVRIDGAEFLHLKNVLRLKEGYTIVVSAGDGVDRYCTINKIAKDYAQASIISKAENRTETKNALVLFFGLLKGGKTDFVIQKAAELGIRKVVPFVSKFCSEKSANLDRLKKIALEASKQCGRAAVTEVGQPIAFSEIFEQDYIKDFKTLVMPYELESKRSISEVEFWGDTALIIGSEGGFSEEEASLAQSRGFTLVSLGRRILRAETAAVVAASAALLKLGELDS